MRDGLFRGGISCLVFLGIVGSLAVSCRADPRSGSTAGPSTSSGRSFESAHFHCRRTVEGGSVGNRQPAEFDRIQTRWLPLVLGYSAVATCAALFAVPIWLGDDFQLAGVLAAILTIGYGLHVALTGIRTCFVRSIGRPGLETRYSVFSTILIGAGEWARCWPSM
jgi:hypothetical protein